MRNRFLPTLGPLVLVATATAGVAAGCAETAHVYVPAAGTGTTLAGTSFAAAEYPIPPDAPAGKAQIASLGVQEIASDHEQRRVLVLRMFVENRSKAPWRVDVSRLVVTFPDGTRKSPDLVSSSRQEQGAPWLEVPANDQVTIQAMYGIPGGKRQAGNFTFDWQVQTPARTLAQRTPFREEQIKEESNDEELVAADASFGLYLGVPFYYTPYYAPFAYYSPPFYSYPYPYYYRHYPYYYRPYARYGPYPYGSRGPHGVPPPRHFGRPPVAPRPVAPPAPRYFPPPAPRHR